MIVAPEVGDLIATIDSRPFHLEVDLKLSQIASLEAAVAGKRESNAADAAAADAAKAALIYAQSEFDRINVLTRDQALSQAELDKARAAQGADAQG